MVEQVATEAPVQTGEAEPSLNIPKGSSVSDAARMLREQRSRKGQERNTAPTHPSGEPDAAPEPAPVLESQAEPHGDRQEIPAEPQTEPDGAVETVEVSDFPATLDGLAETLGVDPRDLSEGLTAKVKLNGKEVDVSLWEALQGYQRESDYSRRQNEMSKREKALQAEHERITGEVQQKTVMVDQWLTVLGNALQAGPDDNQLAQMAQTDPDAYTAAKAHRDQLVNQFNAVVQQRQALEAYNQQQQAETLNKQHDAEVAELLRMSRNKASGLPDFSDAEQRKAWEGKAASYLESRGTSSENVTRFLSRGGWTASQVAIVNDAMRYRDLMQSQQGIGDKLKSKPKVTLPKAGQQRTRTQAAQENVQTALKRLAATGKTQDAQAVLRERRLALKAARKTAR